MSHSARVHLAVSTMSSTPASIDRRARAGVTTAALAPCPHGATAIVLNQGETFVTKLLIAALALATLPVAVPSLALAQAAPAATVTFTTLADMPTLTDNSKQDSFTVGLTDAQIKTQLIINCTAGH